jgi:hypothetical protein
MSSICKWESLGFHESVVDDFFFLEHDAASMGNQFPNVSKSLEPIEQWRDVVFHKMSVFDLQMLHLYLRRPTLWVK